MTQEFGVSSVITKDGLHEKKLFRKRRISDRVQADDDGFESLNGNGSRTSEEEIAPACSCNNDLLTSHKRCDDWVKKQSMSNRSNSESRHSTELESDAETESVDTNVVCFVTGLRSTCNTIFSV